MEERKLSSIHIDIDENKERFSIKKTAISETSEYELKKHWLSTNIEKSILVCCTYNFCHRLENILDSVFCEYRIPERKGKDYYSIGCFEDMIDFVQQIEKYNSNVILIASR